MFDLIEIELTRARRMAEQAEDSFLLYLIDMAIIQENARARSRNSVEKLIPLSLELEAIQTEGRAQAFR